MQRISIFCVAIFIGAALALPRAAADNWVEVTSPNFRVVSNNGERSARDTAWQFEQIRAGIAQGWPWARAPLDRPLLIIGAKDEGTMKVFAPGFYEPGKSIRYSSISASGLDTHYILMRADVTVDGPEGVNPYRTAYWTYCNLMLSSAYHSRLPVWFARGLAAVLSNTNVTEKEIQFGRAVPSYVEEFKRGRYALEQLFAMTRQSPELQREIERQRFDAQSWALVHYMLFDSTAPDERGGRINALTAALRAGTPSAEAVEKVYGPLNALDESYRSSANRGLFRYVQMKTDINIPKRDFQSQPVTPGAIAAIRAGYLIASNRPAEAQAAIAEARQAAPASPASYEAEGLLLERQAKIDEARAAYAKAVELNSEHFTPYLRLATMGQRPPGPEGAAARRAWLEKSIALNDSNAISQQALSAVLMQLNLFAEAIGPARRAVELEPSQVFGHTALATALARAGKKDEAAAEAKLAMSLARSDAERRSVQSVIDMIERIK